MDPWQTDYLSTHLFVPNSDFLSDPLLQKEPYPDNGIPNVLHFHDLGAANEKMFLS